MQAKAVRWINRSKIILLVVFAVGCAAAWGYQYFYIWPKNRCEGSRQWWYGPERACGVPIDVTTFTGRPRGSPEDTAALKAALAKTPTPEKAAAPAPKTP